MQFVVGVGKGRLTGKGVSCIVAAPLLIQVGTGLADGLCELIEPLIRKVLDRLPNTLDTKLGV